MKIVVGIDPSHSSGNVSHLLRRLAFPAAEAIYASFAPYPVVPPPGLASASDELIQRMLNEQRGIASRAMREAMLNLQDVVPGEEMIFDLGNPVHLIEHLAEDRGADLIAIGSRPHRPLEAGLLGSVGRGLALNSKISTLVVKGEVAKAGPVKAVFAYDASGCCEKGIDMLTRLRPSGISHIDVVIVDTPDRNHSPVTDLRGEGAWSLGPERRRDLLLSYAQAASARLAAAGYETRALCAEGLSARAIRGAVIDLDADLVILGARGHRWLERVLLGSFALEQTVDEPHSVLILRPDSE